MALRGDLLEACIGAPSAVCAGYISPPVVHIDGSFEPCDSNDCFVGASDNAQQRTPYSCPLQNMLYRSKKAATYFGRGQMHFSSWEDFLAGALFAIVRCILIRAGLASC